MTAQCVDFATPIWVASPIMWVTTLSARRVWGPLALAISNLCASAILIDPDAMRNTRIHAVALHMMSVWAWGTLFLVAGVGLTVGVARRSLGIVNVFGALSVAGWTALSTAAFATAITEDDVHLSGLAIALFAWMLFGPIAMLLVPLVYNAKLHKEFHR